MKHINWPIEYRAWLLVEKKMLPVLSLTFKNQSALFEAKYGWREFDTLVLMEYLGMKDKAGNKLYDQDICQYSSGNLKIITWDPERGCWSAVDPDGKNGRIGLTTTHILKVGNCFEQPELLQPIL